MFQASSHDVSVSAAYSPPSVNGAKEQPQKRRATAALSGLNLPKK